MTVKAPDILPPKDPAEAYRIKVDLDLLSGDAITDEQEFNLVVAGVAFGTDTHTEEAEFFDGDAEIDTTNGITGIARKIKAGAGVHGCDYRFRADADTGNGEHLTNTCILPVRTK